MYIANTTITMFFRFLIVFFGFVFSVLITQLLGPSGKGLYAVAIMVVGIAQQLTNPGLHSANKFFAARDVKNAPSLLINSVLWSMVAGTTAIGVVLCLRLVVPQWFPGVTLSLLCTALLAVPALVASYLLSNLAIGLERYVFYNLVELANAVFMVLMAVLLIVGFHFRVHALIVAFTVGAWLMLVAMIFYFKRLDLWNWRGYDFSLLKQCLGYGPYLWAACLLTFLVLRFDMLVINYYTGTEGAGWYSIAVMICDALALVPSVIATTLFPRMTALAQQDRDQAFSQLSQTFPSLFLAVTLVAAALFAPFVRIFFGADFLPAIPAFYALAPGVFFLGLQNIFSASLAGRGEVKQMPIIWLITFIVNVVTTIPLVKALGIVGAAYASSFSYFLVFFLMFLYHRRHCDLSVAEQLVPRWENFRLISREFGGMLKGVFARRKTDGPSSK